MPAESRGAVAKHTMWQQITPGERWGIWCILINQPGYTSSRLTPVVSTAPDHRPTVLSLGIEPGRSIKRGGCLGCEWEGPDRSKQTDAIEDAHDHAWPGWRDLPAVKPCKSNYAKWRAEVDRAYPPGWIDAGGPIVTVRSDSRFSRHLVGQSPGGGYDMAATWYQPKRKKTAPLQEPLELGV
ncbi:DUF6349 family protein (plasmid) [Microtetraspora malaysiensis]|uniref:DUF6349 family protein n=1 Tax=Microtetraspora malaysiensis TaxID=161358 RepID=UPI003D901B3B